MPGADEAELTARGVLASWWQRALRFGNGVLGADKYERYLEYHRATAVSYTHLRAHETLS